MTLVDNNKNKYDNMSDYDKVISALRVAFDDVSSYHSMHNMTNHTALEWQIRFGDEAVIPVVINVDIYFNGSGSIRIFGNPKVTVRASVGFNRGHVMIFHLSDYDNLVNEIRLFTDEVFNTLVEEVEKYKEEKA